MKNEPRQKKVDYKIIVMPRNGYLSRRIASPSETHPDFGWNNQNSLTAFKMTSISYLKLPVVFDSVMNNPMWKKVE